MSAPPRWAAAGLLVVLLGAAILFTRTPAAAPALPQAVPPELARFLPLRLNQRNHFDFDWFDGVDSSLFSREVTGWVELEGAPHARVDYRRSHARHAVLYLAEWLRPAGDRVLCTRRQVGERVFRLDPPQPILKSPLSVGATWSWSGQVGERDASATYEILTRRADATWGEVLEVETRTTLGEDVLVQVTVYAEGRGPVSARGVLPRGDLSVQATAFEAAPYPAPE